MPVFNEAAYLKEAVESVAMQETELSFELIIVDDQSTDETPDILRKLEGDYPFIRAYRNPVKGKNNSFNLAFEKSKGELIALFAGDDVLPSRSLQDRAAPLLDSLDMMAASFCKLSMFSEYKKFDGVVTPRAPDRGAMSGGAIMMTRPMASACFPLPSILGNEDMWIVCHATHLENVKIYHVPKVGINYRIHGANSSTRTDSFKRKNESMHVRFIVYGHFLERYREKLSTASILSLSAQAAAETLRYQGASLAIIFMGGLSLADKARFLMHSSAFLYWLRIQLFSLFSGR